MKKKLLPILTAVLLLTAVFSSCQKAEKSNEFHIICTSFPIYDWARNITEGCPDMKLTLLFDNATDPHSYQATAKDISVISSADILISTGGDSEMWINDILENSVERSIPVLYLTESLGEENLYCTENEEHSEHEHGHEHDHHEHGYDEHIWLSPKKALLLCDSIKEFICAHKTEYSDICENNLRAYKERLTRLDKQYEDTVKNAAKDTIIVADRFPFIYLTNDYSLNYCAAFTGCSAESEASADILIKLIEKTKEIKPKAILITETSNGDIAETVSYHTDGSELKILVLNSIQSVKDKDTADYIKIMESNIKILEEALS